MEGWKEAASELPAASGFYLTETKGVILVMHFSARHGVFNAFDGDLSTELAIGVDRWMSLPPHAATKGGESV